MSQGALILVAAIVAVGVAGVGGDEVHEDLLLGCSHSPRFVVSEELLAPGPGKSMITLTIWNAQKGALSVQISLQFLRNDGIKVAWEVPHAVSHTVPALDDKSHVQVQVAIEDLYMPEQGEYEISFAVEEQPSSRSVSQRAPQAALLVREIGFITPPNASGAAPGQDDKHLTQTRGSRSNCSTGGETGARGADGAATEGH